MISPIRGGKKLAQRVSAGKDLEINDKPRRGDTGLDFLLDKTVNREDSPKA
jgi:hypothetical protein